MIELGLKDIDPKFFPERQPCAAVQANVRWSLAQLPEFSELGNAQKDTWFEMVGAAYNLESSNVRLLLQQSAA
jgi:hypothetical protein